MFTQKSNAFACEAPPIDSPPKQGTAIPPHAWKGRGGMAGMLNTLQSC